MRPISWLLIPYRKVITSLFSAAVGTMLHRRESEYNPRPSLVELSPVSRLASVEDGLQSLMGVPLSDAGESICSAISICIRNEMGFYGAVRTVQEGIFWRKKSGSMARVRQEERHGINRADMRSSPLH